jgi:hypothetical protein
MACLAQSRRRLDPTEDFPHLFGFPLADRVTRVARRARIDPAAASRRVPHHMRRHVQFPQRGYESPGVIALVGPQRDPPMVAR